MAGEPTIVAVGRLGNDPDISFTQTGRAVANFSVAVTPRTKDNETWIDKDTLWYRVSLWKNAEEFVDSASKGMLVGFSGKFATHTYETKAGETKTDLAVDADWVGVIPTRKRDAQSAEVPF
jgi:single-strand DNA-binding protein